jgi:hypothetical protein
MALGSTEAGRKSVRRRAAVPDRPHRLQLDGVTWRPELPGPAFSAQLGCHAESGREPGGIDPADWYRAVAQCQNHMIGADIELVSQDEDGHTGNGLSGMKS